MKNKRKPLVASDDEVFTPDGSHDATKLLAEAVNHAFSSEVVSLDLMLLEDAKMYIKYRHFMDDDTGATLESAKLEKRLDSIFWSNSETQSPFVFLEGVEGSGKSTALHYYFRRYCPVEGGHIQEFNRKLIIDINFYWSKTCADAEHTLYTTIERAIIEYFQAYNKYRPVDAQIDLYSIDTFKKCDTSMDWTGPMFAKAPREELEKLVRTRVASFNPKERAEFLMRFLCNSIPRDSTFPIRYVVICLDNLDQSPIEVAEAAIKQVDRWFLQKLAVWRVFIPLWPTTYNILQARIDPFPRNATKLNIGTVDSTALFEKRCQAAIEYIRARSGRIVLEATSSKPEEVQSERELEEYVNAALQHVNDRFAKLFGNLAGGSIRRTLMIWAGTLTSNSLVQHFRQARGRYQKAVSEPSPTPPRIRSPFSFIYNYFWICSMLTNGHRFHSRDFSPIANVFYTVDDTSGPNDLLLGFHILHATRLKSVIAISTLTTFLERLGHELRSIEKAIEYLCRIRIINRDYSVKRDQLYVYPQVADGYYNLLDEPAYIDVMAMTTPVDELKLLAMTRTVSYIPESFTARVKTTLELLQQIKDDEERLCSWRTSNTRLTYEEFRENLDVESVPSLFRKIALPYKARLDYLRQNADEVLPHVTGKEWQDLCDNALLYDVDKRSTILLPRGR